MVVILLEIEEKPSVLFNYLLVCKERFGIDQEMAHEPCWLNVRTSNFKVDKQNGHSSKAELLPK